MPLSNLTSLNIIIDRSGSMKDLLPETVGAFNKLLEEQKALPGDVLFSLTVFDDKVTVLYDSVPIRDVPPLTEELYWHGGGGWTALRDAVGMTTMRVLGRIKTLPDDLKPAKVLFTIITDGQENHSREYSELALRDLIEKARSEWKYEFTMIGANIDSLTTAKAMGFDGRNAINFDATKGGMMRAMNVASAGTRVYREQEHQTAGALYGAVSDCAMLPQDADALHQMITSSVQAAQAAVPAVTPVNLEHMKVTKNG